MSGDQEVEIIKCWAKTGEEFEVITAEEILRQACLSNNLPVVEHGAEIIFPVSDGQSPIVKSRVVGVGQGFGCGKRFEGKPMIWVTDCCL